MTKTCTCYVASEIRLHGSSKRPHMFWCEAFDPMASPAPWANRPSEGLDRTGVVSELTGGDKRGVASQAMAERVMKAIEEVHAPPADAARMGAARPVHGWIIQADAAAKLGLPPDMLIMSDLHGIPEAEDALASRPGDYLGISRTPPPPESHEQPLPTTDNTHHPRVYALVHDDIKARVHLGIHRYGVPLTPHNGRDALRDLYEELIDAVMYTRQVIYERDGK